MCFGEGFALTKLISHEISYMDGSQFQFILFDDVCSGVVHYVDPSGEEQYRDLDDVFFSVLWR